MLYTIVKFGERYFSAPPYVLTVFSGLLTIMVERFLYVRRGYRREARIAAVLGWTYVLGGTVVFIVLAVLRSWL